VTPELQWQLNPLPKFSWPAFDAYGVGATMAYWRGAAAVAAAIAILAMWFTRIVPESCGCRHADQQLLLRLEGSPTANTSGCYAPSRSRKLGGPFDVYTKCPHSTLPKRNPSSESRHVSFSSNLTWAPSR
jgi:hypothetical protein